MWVKRLGKRAAPAGAVRADAAAAHKLQGIVETLDAVPVELVHVMGVVPERDDVGYVIRLGPAVVVIDAAVQLAREKVERRLVHELALQVHLHGFRAPPEVELDLQEVRRRGFQQRARPIELVVRLRDGFPARVQHHLRSVVVLPHGGERARAVRKHGKQGDAHAALLEDFVGLRSNHRRRDVLIEAHQSDLPHLARSRRVGRLETPRLARPVEVLGRGEPKPSVRKRVAPPVLAASDAIVARLHAEPPQIHVRAVVAGRVKRAQRQVVALPRLRARFRLRGGVHGRGARVRDDFAVVVARVKRRARGAHRRAGRRAEPAGGTPQHVPPVALAPLVPRAARQLAGGLAGPPRRVARPTGQVRRKAPARVEGVDKRGRRGDVPSRADGERPFPEGRSHRGDVDVRLAEHELAVRVDAERRQGVRRVRRALKRKLNLGGFAVEPAPRSRRRILLAQQHVLRRRGASHAEEQDAVRGVGAIVEGDFVPAEEPTRAALAGRVAAQHEHGVVVGVLRHRVGIRRGARGGV